jgi:hypothetical protein
MYKHHLLQSIDREILLAKQLAPFIDETKLDFRFGEKTRSTIEVMRYLTTIGSSVMQYYASGMTDEHWKEINKESKTTTVQNFAERMDEQQKIIHSYFEKISDDDLLYKEVELFWDEKMPLGVAIMQGPLKWLTSYRMELFKLVKLSGGHEISTGVAWVPKVEKAS